MSEQFSRPGRPGPDPPDRSATVFEHHGTVLETDEDLRQALLANFKPHRPEPFAPPAPPVAAPKPKAQAPAVGRLAEPFRPSIRPPSPILVAFDDGKAEGEVIRIRQPRFTIGRSEGDFRVPLDGRMSAKHVEITHQAVGGQDRWVVTDLQSTHGLYVRVSKTVLVDGAEFLVGGGRYRFDANRPEPGAPGDPLGDAPMTGETQGWSDGPGPFRPPALTEWIGREIGNRTLLVRDEYWIGSDPTCAIGRPDDPFCEPRHVRLARDPKGRWAAANNKTANGLWLKMAQIAVDSMIQFQVGEQRFRLTV